jgi:predicted GNAT family acetyltransferase
VELREHEDAESFLAAASPLLLEDEARHNLILGLCATLVEAPGAHPDFRLWTIDNSGATVGAALMTPPHNLVVAKPRTAAALQFLADELHRRGVRLPGATAALPEVDEFATAWERVAQVRRRQRIRQGIYAARAARVPDGVTGAMRLATEDDRPLLLEWWEAFEDEAVPPDAPRGRATANADRRLRSEGGGVALWDDGGPVSLAGFGPRTPHGIRIGPVYTPPARRRHGYAGALVGQLTVRLLAERDFCCLYTDLGNPTSNRIYQNVGYELVAESADYAFDRAE